MTPEDKASFAVIVMSLTGMIGGMYCYVQGKKKGSSEKLPEDTPVEDAKTPDRPDGED